MWPALYAATLLSLYPSSVLGQFLLGVGTSLLCVHNLARSHSALCRTGIGDVTGPVTEVRLPQCNVLDVWLLIVSR